MASLGSRIAKLFESFPEGPMKNRLRVFLSFNPLVPNFLSDLSPLKGYELHYSLRKGDIVVDCGAYTGDYTIFAAKKVGPTGRVIAFEPDKKNLKILEKNIRYEKLHNVIVVNKGLWNKNTSLKFNSSGTLHSSLEPSQGTLQEVKVVRLDDELPKLGFNKIDVLKMDIEGAEIEAVEGAIKTLKKNKVNVMIASYHIVDGKRTSYAMEAFLKKIGYNALSDFKKHLTTYGWK